MWLLAIVQLNTQLAEFNKLLQRFWELEDGPDRTFISLEDKKCEQLFVETTTRTPEGRYVVKQFLSTEKRMIKDPNFAQHYRQFMKEFIDLGHMTNDEENGYYTHYGIVSGEKFRAIFNSSYPTSSGLSLNDS